MMILLKTQRMMNVFGRQLFIFRLFPFDNSGSQRAKLAFARTEHSLTKSEALTKVSAVTLCVWIAKGGLELSLPVATAELALAIILLIIILPQKAGRHPENEGSAT